MDTCSKPPSDHKKHMKDFLKKLENSKTSPVITDSQLLIFYKVQSQKWTFTFRLMSRENAFSCQCGKD